MFKCLDTCPAGFVHGPATTDLECVDSTGKGCGVFGDAEMNNEGTGC